jgi:MraZ protein
MALFLSTFENKVDKKGRVSVPAPFRAAISNQSFQGIIVFRSSQYDCLEGFSMAQMQELSERLDQFDMFSAEQDDLATAIFAESTALNFDSTGRVVLPDELKEYANIDDRAAFVGMGPKFQIWEPDALQRRRQEARKSVKDEGLTIPNKPAKGGA